MGRTHVFDRGVKEHCRWLLGSGLAARVPASGCAQGSSGCEAGLVQAAQLEEAQALTLDLGSDPGSAADRLCDLRRFLM